MADDALVGIMFVSRNKPCGAPGAEIEAMFEDCWDGRSLMALEILLACFCTYSLESNGIATIYITDEYTSALSRAVSPPAVGDLARLPATPAPSNSFFSFLSKSYNSTPTNQGSTEKVATPVSTSPCPN